MLTTMDRRFALRASRPPASDEDIERLRAFAGALGAELPADFVDLIREATEVEIAVEGRDSLRFWSPTRMLELNEAYEMPRLVPGAIAVGDIGEDVLVLMAAARAPGVYRLVFADPDELEYLARSLADLVAVKTDLGSLFRAGQGASGTWGYDEVWKTLEALAGPGEEIDWEPGNEQWGRVLDVGTVIGMVCARVPVGVVQAGVPAGRVSGRVAWLRVESMDAQMYRVDRELLEQVFGGPLSNAVDYEQLSIADVWYATVT